MNNSMPMQQNAPIDRSAFYKWSKIIGYLEGLFGKATIAAWAEDAIVTEFSEDILRIEAGNNFKCDIMKRRCLNHIQNVLKEVFNSDAKVEIYAKEG